MKCPLCDRTEHCGGRKCYMPKPTTLDRICDWLAYAAIIATLTLATGYVVVSKFCAATYCGGPTW